MSQPDLRGFVTVDLNGWLDHLCGIDGKPRTLGFRSAFMEYPVPSSGNKDFAGLFGAQALATARYSMNDDTLIDAFGALLDESNFQKRGDSTPPLPVLSVLWQLVVDETRRLKRPADLALVIPDIPKFGKQDINKETGRTRIETLYRELEKSRPIELASSRIKLVWRSVATVRAVLDRKNVEAKQGRIFVVNVNRQTSWTTLHLRNWSRESQAGGPLCIVRAAEMGICQTAESLTTQRMKIVKSSLDDRGVDFKKVKEWTRWAEILASGMNKKTARRFGIGTNALEHRSWPSPDGNWVLCAETPRIKFETTMLPSKLEARLKEFLQDKERLAVILECPAGEELIDDYWCSIVELAGETPVYWVTGSETVQAASQLAIKLEQDQANPPAWLDVVPEIQLEVKKRGWLPVIPKDEVIPAGEPYHSSTAKVPWIELAPGIEQVHIHVRRGSENNWDERYSGKHTGHTIRPSDHIKNVKPQAKIRPLSGDARLEIIERSLVGGEQTLIGSKASIRWNEMSPEPPLALRSIPDLFIFRPCVEAWDELAELLKRLVAEGRSMTLSELSDRNEIKDKIYNCATRRWRSRTFPLGSDGLPHQEISNFKDAQILIKKATSILFDDLDFYVTGEQKLKSFKEANRTHLPLTWMFTACPDEVVKVLLDAITNLSGDAAKMLYMNYAYSKWPVYSGVGRAVLEKQSLQRIFDELIGKWESENAGDQDIFLLAAVTHPMARRVDVRHILNDDKNLFDRVRKFLDCQLSNLLKGKNDPKVGRRPKSELRYTTMGYRGLCQVRYANPSWLLTDCPHAQWVHDSLLDLLEALHVDKDPLNELRQLVQKTAPYIIGKGEDPTMPIGSMP